MDASRLPTSRSTLALVLLRSDVLFAQRLLRCGGFYAGPLDGIWSASVDAAEAAFAEETQKTAQQLQTFDPRSERSLVTLLPKAQVAARNSLARIRSTGFDARILSGTRTYAEQNTLYRKGRFGNTEPKVTRARGGQSNHNFGIAWDIGIFVAGAYVGNDLGPYREAAQPGMEGDLEWGGNWQSFPDFPHYQLRTDLPLDEVRARFEAGSAFV
jgi:peptidoglycan LD-endopeptidase CwlK